MLTTNRKKAKRYSFHPSFREAESTPSSGAKGKLFGLLRLCQTETSHRAQRLTAAHGKKRQRAFLRKKIKVLQVFNKHTYSHNQAKRHQRVIMCTQKERAQTSNVTRFARDGVGPFDCTCVCWVELDTISSGNKDRSR